MKRLLFSLVIFPISLFAGSGLPDKPYIYVDGTAEIQKIADTITLKFDALATAPDRTKANEEVQLKVKKILEVLRERKIADSDVIAESIHSQPEIEPEEKNGWHRQKIIGYNVTRPIEVKVRDIAIFPKLVDDLIALGGVEFADTESGLSNQKELQEQLRQKALANARGRADTIAKAMGVKVESIFAISTVSFSEVQNKMFPVERVIVTGSNIPTGRTPAPEYRLATVTVSDEVHVIYLISPAK